MFPLRVMSDASILLSVVLFQIMRCQGFSSSDLCREIIFNFMTFLA